MTTGFYFQVTSNPYGDRRAIPVVAASFSQGSLPLASYVRPGKLFTANRLVIVRHVALLKPQALKQVVDAVIELLRGAT